MKTLLRPTLRSQISFNVTHTSRLWQYTKLPACTRHSSNTSNTLPTINRRQRYTASLQPSPCNTGEVKHLENLPDFLPSPAQELTYMRKWGFVAYRGTYKDEGQWETAIHFLYSSVLKDLQSMLKPQHDIVKLWNQLEFTVIEDRARLEDASTQTVRELHREWLLTSSGADRGGPMPEDWMRETELRPGDTAGRWELYTRGPEGFPRYAYCVYIDDAALESIIAYKDRDRASKNAYVRVVQAYWRDETRPEEDEGEVEPDEDQDEGERPVEGCTRFNIGWMKFRALDMLFLYTMLHERPWEHEYLRPPSLSPI